MGEFFLYIKKNPSAFVQGRGKTQRIIQMTINIGINFLTKPRRVSNKTSFWWDLLFECANGGLNKSVSSFPGGGVSESPSIQHREEAEREKTVTRAIGRSIARSDSLASSASQAPTPTRSVVRLGKANSPFRRNEWAGRKGSGTKTASAGFPPRVDCRSREEERSPDTRGGYRKRRKSNAPSRI